MSTDDLEVVWSGASWREVPREAPPAPTAAPVTIDGVLQRRVITAMLDGHARSIYQMARRARLTTAQTRHIVAPLLQAHVFVAFDAETGPRDVAGAVRRRYQLVASIATGTASDQLRARVLDVLDVPRTVREVRVVTGLPPTKVDHCVRALWQGGRLDRRERDGEPGRRPYEYWQVR